MPAVEHAQKTHPGRDPDKQVNEDSSAFEATPLGFLAVVCDGMGGHASGQEASRLAVQTIVEEVRDAGATASPPAVLERAVTLANARVHEVKGPEGTILRPGSTCVAVLVHPAGTFVAHVGDSRAYLVHAGAIHQITRDHSKVQLLVDAGYITPEEAKTHPDANQITRALGISALVDVDVRREPIAHAAGDVLVLCSDGLSDLVMPDDILRVIDGPAQQAAGQLVDLANARGGHDNITVQIVRVKEAATRASTLVSPVDGTQPDTALGSTAPGEPMWHVGPTAIDPDATAPVQVPLRRQPDMSADSTLRTEVPHIRGVASADSTARTLVPMMRPEQVELPHEPGAPPAALPAPRAEIPTVPPPPRPRSPLLFVGAALGVVAFAALIALLYLENKRHRDNALVVAPPESTAPSASVEAEDAAAPVPSLDRAPPLPSAEPPRPDQRRRRQTSPSRLP